MFVVHDVLDRKEYWERFWADVGVDVDTISRDDVYPLYPAVRHVAPGARILECGCGMGRVVKHYVAAGHEVVGMDYEAACVARLRRQRPDLQLYAGDVHALPHPPASFDVVLAFGTLSNMADASGPLHELHRVLRAGGLLVASVTNDSLARRILTRARALRAAARHFSMVAYRPQEWRGLLEAHGFSVLEIAPVVTRLPIFTYFPWLRAAANPALRWTAARDGDSGLRLNRAGEWLFRTLFRSVPFVVSHGVVGVARKVSS
jgi:ubiquinone/menaquinone biosynthesis C-methylase UbiE